MASEVHGIPTVAIALGAVGVAGVLVCCGILLYRRGCSCVSRFSLFSRGASIKPTGVVDPAPTHSDTLIDVSGRSVSSTQPVTGKERMELVRLEDPATGMSGAKRTAW